MKIDTDSFFQNRINSIFLTTSWVEKVKALLGIEAVSQVWGDQPAWYLWLSGAHGAYQLQLVDPSPDGNNHSEGIQGIFSVKCYPFADHDVFKTFSTEERRLVNSQLFDDTHTPRFDDREKITDTLFNVAAIDYAVDREDTSVCLTLESLSTLRVVNNEPRTHDTSLVQNHPNGKRRKPDRLVPGWRLGLPLFDRLLSMVAFYSRTAPLRIRVTRSSGFDYTRNGSPALVLNDAADISCYTASVLFSPVGKEHQGSGLAGTTLMEQATDMEQSEVLFDKSFPENRFQPPGESALTGISDVFPINEQWWSLANADYQSELGSTCGCHGDNDHPCQLHHH